MFSEMENEIIRIIGRKKITVQEISKELFQDVKAPFDAEISVTNTLRRIIDKCIHHKLDWTLNREKTGRKYIVSKEKV